MERTCKVRNMFRMVVDGTESFIDPDLIEAFFEARARRKHGAQRVEVWVDGFKRPVLVLTASTVERKYEGNLVDPGVWEDVLDRMRRTR